MVAAFDRRGHLETPVRVVAGVGMAPALGSLWLMLLGSLWFFEHIPCIHKSSCLRSSAARV